MKIVSIWFRSDRTLVMMILDFNSKRNFFSILSMKHDLLTRFVRSHLEMDRILSGFFYFCPRFIPPFIFELNFSEHFPFHWNRSDLINREKQKMSRKSLYSSASERSQILIFNETPKNSCSRNIQMRKLGASTKSHSGDRITLACLKAVNWP